MHSLVANLIYSLTLTCQLIWKKYFHTVNVIRVKGMICAAVAKGGMSNRIKFSYSVFRGLNFAEILAGR